jgi:hypothetical protein
MRWVLALVLVTACTEHGKGGGDEWDVRENQFAEAVCVNACVPDDQQDECIVDVITDMDQAKASLPASGQAACIECMRVKTQLMPQIVANGCQSNTAIDAQVFAACDDPATDFDGDGDPANDFSEVCLGFP